AIGGAARYSPLATSHAPSTRSTAHGWNVRWEGMAMADMQRMGDVLARTARNRAAAGNPRLARRNTTPSTSAQATEDAERAASAERAAALRAKLAEIIPPRPVNVTSLSCASGAVTASSANGCPLCGGAGWVRVAQIGDDGQWQAQLAPCMGQQHEQERYERARRLSDISDKLTGLDFTAYDPTDNPAALAAAQAWASDAGR